MAEAAGWLVGGVDAPWFVYVLVGFAAQLVDGTLGMAYGVTCTTLLLGIGISPAMASASVHAAEVCTTAVAGGSHTAFGHLDRALLRRLLVPGVVGAVVGAYALASAPGPLLRPLVAAYLLVMGLLVLRRALVDGPVVPQPTRVGRLGLAAGFCDAAGGGGWGAICISSLLARGGGARTTIGTVIVAEFFVALAASVVFVATIGVGHWPVVGGLMLGGALAAVPAAWLCRRAPTRPLMAVVGVVIVVLSVDAMGLSRWAWSAYRSMLVP